MDILKKHFACAVAFALAATTMAGCNAFTPLDVQNTSAEAPTESGSKADAYDSGAPGDVYSDTVAPDGAYSNACLSPEPSCPEPYNSEEYAEIDESGFFSTKARPLSTFSADVDTAAYCNIRRMATQGYEARDIPADAVRIEEMLNYFDYDYPEPQQGELFGVSSQISDCPWNPDAKLLIMGFATEAGNYGDGEGSNLVFLIDTSGSMASEDKLPLLQASFSRLLNQLSERDRVSIVTYSGEEKVVCEGVPGNEKRDLQRAIDSLDAGGSTNGEAGLERAYELAKSNFIKGGVNRIIMASDGDLNVGMSSVDELNIFVEKKRETGVYLSVLGFGSGNYKDNKMEVLADHGNGNYHYIDCLSEAEKVFEQDLCANLVTVAKDTKLQIEFNPAWVKGYRQVGYENRALADEDFLDDSVDAGEVGSGHQVTVAYELIFDDSDAGRAVPDLKYRSPEPEGGAADADASDEWLTCSVRYQVPGTGKSVQNDYPVGAGSYTSSPSDDWKFAASVLEAGLVLRDSEYKGMASLGSARERLFALHLDEDRQEFAALLDRLRGSSYGSSSDRP